jgi:uncharacterized protein
VKLTIDAAPSRPIALKLRIPGWLHEGGAQVVVNGDRIAGSPKSGTYLEVKRTWQPGDIVTLRLDFTPTLWEANPLVEETVGQVAVKFGPIVYCLESQDLPRDVQLGDVRLKLAPQSNFTARRETIAGATLAMLETTVLAAAPSSWHHGELYREVRPAASHAITAKLVPYYAWGNRGDGEMSVWLPLQR